MKFTYRSGQQPLPGYTIKRGIGLGGFGEVYFAVTDGGKEVALKWIRFNLDIEMRGVHQCLNLKHPNLVHLYDVRADAQGNPWLVMEYIAGDTLSTIMSRHPNGVAPELAAQWFQGLALAIHCLHEHGIVHRDLKPGNIFVEHGIVKIGDYGLCKLIDDSRQAGMTKNVGTALYMAPEISKGNYTRKIDIYAAGVLLYEMLTGRVPFEGESELEIMMKHATAQPDLSRVPKEFVPLLQKALDKDPAKRFETIQEMAKAVALLVGMKPVTPVPQIQPVTIIEAKPGVDDYPMAIPVTPTMVYQQRGAELAGMLLWSVLGAAVLSLSWVLIFGRGDDRYANLPSLFFMIVAASWSVMIPSKLWAPGSDDDSWTRRLMHMTLGFGLGIFALWLDGYELPVPWRPTTQVEVLHPWQPNEATQQALKNSWAGHMYGENVSLPIVACYLSFFGLMFLVLRWWRVTEVNRSKRLSILSVGAVALWGYIFLFLLPSLHHRELGFVSLVGASIVVQMTSPWKGKVSLKKKHKAPKLVMA